jgi:hypothetical protein
MGGPLVAVRYYLGRLLEQNLFQASDDQVSRALADFIAAETSKRGAALISRMGIEGWTVAQVVLHHVYQVRLGRKSSKSSRRAAAVEALLRDPNLDDRELARIARTTPKQLARIPELTVLRRATRK